MNDLSSILNRLQFDLIFISFSFCGQKANYQANYQADRPLLEEIVS